jgi:hypothetical protein
MGSLCYLLFLQRPVLGMIGVVGAVELDDIPFTVG